MTNRQQLIRRLLTSLHLNMLDRKEFIEKAIKLNEIKLIIQQDLEDKKVFPSDATIWEEGQPVFEGHFLKKTTDNKYKLYWQRHQAENPYKLAESHEEDYNDFDKIVDDYIKREYNYNIDGLKIMR